MDASDVLDVLSVRIYEPPLANIRDDDRLSDTSNPLSVIMLLIDYETECSMNGITGYLGNCSGQRLPEAVDVLRKICCSDQADDRHKIGIMSASGGDLFHDPCTITSERIRVQWSDCELQAPDLPSAANTVGRKAGRGLIVDQFMGSRSVLRTGARKSRMYWETAGSFRTNGFALKWKHGHGTV
jgi:hypothetical protein